MKNIKLPQITTDRLLNLKVGESEYIIMPICNQSKLIQEHYGNDGLMIPLQQGAGFYIGSKLCWDCEYYTEDYNDTDSLNFCSNNKSKYHYDAIDNIPNTTCSRMKPHQSRFQCECLSVEVVKMDNIDIIFIYDNELNSLLSFEEHLDDLVSQYNKLHNTNIISSIDDYIFLIEVRRTK